MLTPSCFAHADQAMSRGVHAIVGPHRPRLRHRHRRLAGRLAIHALVGEVGEVRRAVVHRVGRAAVLVHARADVEAGRRHVDVICRQMTRLHDHIPPALRRPAFEPIHVVSIELNLIQSQRAGGNASRGQR